MEIIPSERFGGNFFVWYAMKDWIKNIFAFLLVGVVIVAGLWVKGSALSGVKGERTFYLHSVSSWAEQKSALEVLDLPFVTGESVCVRCDNTEELLADVLQTYAAQVVFIEEAQDVYSYYCFSQLLPKKIVLNGRAVNLHIAVAKNQERVVVGYPIIFGGY